MTILKKILKTIVIILLILFPFLGGALLSKHTPYTEGNSMTIFVALYLVLVFVVLLSLIFITTKYKHSFVQPVLPGILLFVLGCVMTGIAGLAVAPDLSIKMLEHPEREHFRYILLFIGALFYGLFFVQLLTKNVLQLNNRFKWVMIILFALTMTELLWEFSYHYFYPEGLKNWIDKGNKAEDFAKSYDNWRSIITGAIGRFLIYVLMLWLSLRLYKIHRIAIWSLIINTFLCVLGIVSSIAFFLYGAYNIETPKEFGFLILFIIPGLPFLIMYWIGIALLTKTNKLTTSEPKPINQNIN
ncbi:MAG: hypothetical protein JST69_08985 [Bacteroidetes bacterium]|nr:hypothetical protein [Bacteroidota bacterium]